MPQLLTELQPVTITTTGSAGSAAGSGVTGEIVNGMLYGCYLDYHASAPATTKLVIQDSAGRVLWTGTANNNGIGNTDKILFPRAGVAASEMVPLAGRKITFAVSLSDALTGALVVTPFILN